jgi:hypothetical protein
MKIYISYLLVCVVSFIIGYIASSKENFNKFLNLLKVTFLGIVERIDKSVTGVDGSYSHTKIVNLLWGIGGFCLICVVTLREIKIPVEVLCLIAGAMGITGIQSVVNKGRELTFAAKNIFTSKNETVEANEDVKPN